MPRAFAANAGGRREFVDEAGHEKWLPILNAPCEPDLGERTGDEIACAHEAPMEHRTGAPSDADVPGLDHLERDDRGVDQVPQFVGKESEPLVLANGASVDGGLIAFAPVLGDRVRDGVVKAARSASESHPC